MCCRHACKGHAVKENGEPIDGKVWQAMHIMHMMAASARTRT
jgi:hypothetical protein